MEYFTRLGGLRAANGLAARRVPPRSRAGVRPNFPVLAWVESNAQSAADGDGIGAGDFSARAGARSPSGIAMEPRSKAGSFARTVHFFRKVSGPDFWDGGIAYDGDLSVYPADFARPVA